MAAAMLSIELKRTDQVKFVKKLQKYIKNEFGADMWDRMAGRVQDFENLREDIRQGAERTDAALKKVMQLHGLLCSLEKRLPINESNISICFYWYDSNSRKRAYQYDIRYDTLSTLFNIGALESQIANNCDLSTDDGIKGAGHYFQMAAGSFAALRNTLAACAEIQKAAPPDMSAEFLEMATNLMLAQAQECFVQKACKAGMNPMVVGKLATAAADLYARASEHLSNNALRSSIPTSWQSHIPLKIAHMRALAALHHAAHLEKNTEYGAQVGYLRSAMAAIDEITPRSIRNVGESTKTSFESVKSKVQAALQSAEYHNNKIYHELVPKSLSGIEGKQLVKETPVPPTAPAVEDDPFKDVVPFAISQAVSVYSSQRDGVLADLTRFDEENTQLSNTMLASMNLPGALEAMETPSGIPQAVHDKIRQYKASGGVQRIRELSSTLQQLSEADLATLDEAIDVLDQEEKDNEQMEERFGARWTRTPSHALTAQLREEANKFRANVEHARKSDAYIQRKFEGEEALLRKMSGGDAEIQSLLPRAPPPSQEALVVVQQLRRLLEELSSVLNTRKGFIKEATELSKRDDIAALLISSHLPQDAIFQQELQKYSAVQERTQRNVAEQERIIGEISTLNDRFNATKGDDTTAKQREEQLQKIDNAFKIYKELEGHLIEGIQFYTNFGELLRRFKSKCCDFKLARDSEKEDMIAQLNAQTAQAQAQAAADSRQASQAQAQQQQQQQQQPSLYGSSTSSISFNAAATPQQQQQQQPQLMQQFQMYAQPPVMGGAPQQHMQPMMASPQFANVPPGYVPVQTPQGLMMMPAHMVQQQPPSFNPGANR